MRWLVRWRVPSLDVMLRFGACAGYVDFGVVRERDVRCEEVKIVRSEGRGMKSLFEGVVEDESGSMTQFRDILVVANRARESCLLA